MNRCVLSIVLLTASFIGFAQNTDTFKKFDVGPFEVVDEDNNYRLRDGVNIMEYFKLKKPMKKNSFQMDLFFGMRGDADINTYGIDFVWKNRISGSWFLNIGVAAAVPSAKLNNVNLEKSSGPDVLNYSSSIMSSYVGIPLTLECMWGRNSLASGYFGFGIVPGWCCIGALGVKNAFDSSDNYSESGYFVAPRVDLGFYAPAGKSYLRAGILFEYKIAITEFVGAENIFKYSIGCLMPGVSLGLVF